MWDVCWLLVLLDSSRHCLRSMGMSWSPDPPRPFVLDTELVVVIDMFGLVLSLLPGITLSESLGETADRSVCPFHS